jgi:hypothetical protein
MDFDRAQPRFSAPLISEYQLRIHGDGLSVIGLDGTQAVSVDALADNESCKSRYADTIYPLIAPDTPKGSVRIDRSGCAQVIHNQDIIDRNLPFAASS